VELVFLPLLEDRPAEELPERLVEQIQEGIEPGECATAAPSDRA